MSAYRRHASPLTDESVIVAAQWEAVGAMLRALDGTRCPNCYDVLPPIPALTPTGVVVCDKNCVDGWMNGEKALQIASLTRRFRVG